LGWPCQWWAAEQMMAAAQLNMHCTGPSPATCILLLFLCLITCHQAFSISLYRDSSCKQPIGKPMSNNLNLNNTANCTADSVGGSHWLSCEEGAEGINYFVQGWWNNTQCSLLVGPHVNILASGGDKSCVPYIIISPRRNIQAFAKISCLPAQSYNYNYATLEIAQEINSYLDENLQFIEKARVY
jgi:hypothetical protein